MWRKRENGATQLFDPVHREAAAKVTKAFYGGAMSGDDNATTSTPSLDVFTEMLRIQGEAARQVMAGVLPGAVGPADGASAA